MTNEHFRFPIGLLGASGSGKTTLINALLGERALPEGDFAEACTAAPVEVAYGSTYHAEISFVTKESWNEELKVLFEEAEEREDEAANAEIARKKLAAVYGEAQATKVIARGSQEAAE